jgi:hypothetical protein
MMTDRNLMRPLYIQGTAGTLIKLDAPALRILAPNRADLLFPLHRVSRVIVSGTAIWDTEALLACADQGITVSFLNEVGELRARWLGKNGERQTIFQRLTDLIGRPDGKCQYESWFMAMEQMAIRSVIKKLVSNSNIEVSTRQILEFFEGQRKTLPIQAAETIYCRMNGVLKAELTQLFSDIGLGTESELLLDCWLNLPEDFSRLIFWDLQIPLLNWLEQRTAYPEQRDIISFYDTRSKRINYLFTGLLSKLHRWLIELY